MANPEKALTLSSIKTFALILTLYYSVEKCVNSVTFMQWKAQLCYYSCEQTSKEATRALAFPT